jgi:hypothetical protein
MDRKQRMDLLMPEIRAATLAIYAEDEQGNPMFVVPDEWGVLRPITKHTPKKDVVIHGKRENVVVLEPERG